MHHWKRDEQNLILVAVHGQCMLYVAVLIILYVIIYIYNVTQKYECLINMMRYIKYH